MKIRKEIKDQLEELKTIRRRIHQNPEIGFDTFQTMETIQTIMNQNAAEYDGFSGVFYLDNKSKSSIGFRCELDGLPIKEKNQVSYHSLNDYMHACGHDAHMAIMIILMKYLFLHEKKTSVLFIFQPAEESGAGAKHMIEKKILEKYHVQELYAVHVLPRCQDVIASKSGELMAASCEIKVKIHSKGGHAAHQNQRQDAMKAMHAFLSEVYQLQKENSTFLVHFGKVECGSSSNVIADECILDGTMRSFDEKMMITLKNMLSEMLMKVDQSFQSNSVISFSSGYEIVKNDRKMVDKIKTIAGQQYQEIDPMMLSEDFSFYSAICPCCLFFCGLSEQHDLHDACFDVDEKECLKAIEVMIQLVEMFDYVKACD